MERADRMPRSLGTLREHDNLRSLTDAGDGFEHCIALIAQTSLLEDVHEQARVTKRSGRCDGAASLVAASPTHAQAPASAASAQARATIIGGVGASLISFASKNGGDSRPTSPPPPHTRPP